MRRPSEAKLHTRALAASRVIAAASASSCKRSLASVACASTSSAVSRCSASVAASLAALSRTWWQGVEGQWEAMEGHGRS